MSMFILYTLIIILCIMIIATFIRIGKIINMISINVTKPEIPRKEEFPPFHLEISQFLMELGFSSMILHKENNISHIVIEKETEMIPICELPNTSSLPESKEYKEMLETIKKDILDLLKERNLYVENK